MFDTAVVPHPQ